MEAFELRHKNDYGQRHAIAYHQAQKHFARARRFLELAGGLIGPVPHFPVPGPNLGGAYPKMEAGARAISEGSG